MEFFVKSLLFVESFQVYKTQLCTKMFDQMLYQDSVQGLLLQIKYLQTFQVRSKEYFGLRFLFALYFIYEIKLPQ